MPCQCISVHCAIDLSLSVDNWFEPFERYVGCYH